MRLTKEELLKEEPRFKGSKHDIVKMGYGDEPYDHWNKEKHEWFSTLTGTLANIHAVEAYIHSAYGDYYIYNTLVGRTYIKEDGTVLTGDANIIYKGKRYNIILNKMYGRNGLHIDRINDDGTVTGFRNADGLGSPASRKWTKELDAETIEKIVNNPMEDYGVGIQKFMEAVRETYKADTTNHIMERCFDLERR